MPSGILFLVTLGLSVGGARGLAKNNRVRSALRPDLDGTGGTGALAPFKVTTTVNCDNSSNSSPCSTDANANGVKVNSDASLRRLNASAEADLKSAAVQNGGGPYKWSDYKPNKGFEWKGSCWQKWWSDSPGMISKSWINDEPNAENMATQNFRKAESVQRCEDEYNDWRIFETSRSSAMEKIVQNERYDPAGDCERNMFPKWTGTPPFVDWGDEDCPKRKKLSSASEWIDKCTAGDGHTEYSSGTEPYGLCTKMLRMYEEDKLIQANMAKAEAEYKKMKELVDTALTSQAQNREDYENFREDYIARLEEKNAEIRKAIADMSPPPWANAGPFDECQWYLGYEDNCPWGFKFNMKKCICEILHCEIPDDTQRFQVPYPKTVKPLLNKHKWQRCDKCAEGFMVTRDRHNCIRVGNLNGLPKYCDIANEKYFGRRPGEGDSNVECSSCTLGFQYNKVTETCCKDSWKYIPGCTAYARKCDDEGRKVCVECQKGMTPSFDDLGRSGCYPQFCLKGTPATYESVDSYLSGAAEASGEKKVIPGYCNECESQSVLVAHSSGNRWEQVQLVANTDGLQCIQPYCVEPKVSVTTTSGGHSTDVASCGKCAPGTVRNGVLGCMVLWCKEIEEGSGNLPKCKTCYNDHFERYEGFGTYADENTGRLCVTKGCAEPEDPMLFEETSPYAKLFERRAGCKICKEGYKLTRVNGANQCVKPCDDPNALQYKPNGDKPQGCYVKPEPGCEAYSKPLTQTTRGHCSSCVNIWGKTVPQPYGSTTCEVAKCAKLRIAYTDSQGYFDDLSKLKPSWAARSYFPLSCQECKAKSGIVAKYAVSNRDCPSSDTCDISRPLDVKPGQCIVPGCKAGHDSISASSVECSKCSEDIMVWADEAYKRTYKVLMKDPYDFTNGECAPKYCKKAMPVVDFLKEEEEKDWKDRHYLHVVERTSRGWECKASDRCGGYPSWCYTTNGKWDYCTEIGKETSRGWECRTDPDRRCDFHGYSFQWCRTTNSDWDYCTRKSPFADIWEMGSVPANFGKWTFADYDLGTHAMCTECESGYGLVRQNFVYRPWSGGFGPFVSTKVSPKVPSTARVVTLQRCQKCRDADYGAGDRDGDVCSKYRKSWCNKYDDSDFKSNDMCCTCGGGCYDSNWDATDRDNDGCDAYANHPHWCGKYDDEDFSSNSMCCACKGGSTTAEATGWQNLLMTPVG